MRHLFLTVIYFLNISAFAQKHTALPHGMVFGIRPNITAMVDAAKVEELMGKRTRINTTIRGWVTKVTKQKGGWFELDAGKGKIIAAHFKNYAIIIPTDLKGKIVIAEGIAEKQFMADDLQHLAGDTVTGKKQHMVKTNPLRSLTFEVKGLMVDQ